MGEAIEKSVIDFDAISVLVLSVHYAVSSLA